METIYLNHSTQNIVPSKAESCVIALGFFDGMHLGHQEVIESAKRIAEERQLTFACMSFFPHPKEVLLSGSEKVQYLMPMAEKQKVLHEKGVEKFYIVEFNRRFASLSPKQFVYEYLLQYGVEHVVAGFDFTYGYRGEGHMGRLAEDADGKLDVLKVEEVGCKGQKISSTLIRKLICSGRMDLIEEYLGRSYELAGKIRVNNDVFNIVIDPYYLLPASGEYEVLVKMGVAEWVQTATVVDGKVILQKYDSQQHFLHDFTNVRLEWKRCLVPVS
ncbi:FAD synthetase family protein [Sporosarcina pasteurii]|uniref:FAD synthase n=1 Tax=Sporosarcina pasteurii TaxID=1474 RepID=A0A380BBW1_SPOPA|nr:FAD synthetase family protein [Sporosarcina pasteurii]MDS9472849.1 FAD synthetase family protein [Sporosarcina pasteurii]QBQ06402.1 FAD synthetase family protein [Sporosarcina pasteurii]SUI98780.1 Riboflavin biosynthesis protein ribF [Sporosarcina pasteurii]